jgi:group I intron endonuclease
LNKISAIYCIENVVNGLVYIGQSVDVYARFRRHRSELKLNIHSNIHLQRAYNINNQSFSYYIIEECPKELLNERETYYIRLYNAFGSGGYNCNEGGDFTGGKPLSEETKKKISISKTGKTPDQTYNIEKKKITAEKRLREQREKDDRKVKRESEWAAKRELNEKLREEERLRVYNSRVSHYLGVGYLKPRKRWSAKLYKNDIKMVRIL